MLKTVINKYTGKEHRAQFHDIVSDDEMLIDALRTEDMENPYWDFDNEIFYNNPITNSLE